MTMRKLIEISVPERIEEASEVLQRYGGNALILAGGSFIRGIDSRGMLSDVEALVDIRKLGLGELHASSEGLRIGAMARFAELAAAPEVSAEPWLGAVSDALACPPLQIRNVATVGGCLAASCPYFDLPVAFMALDGKVAAIGPEGRREIALGDLFTGMFENSLSRGEIISELLLPRPGGRCASAFMKLEDSANDLAIMNGATSLTVDARGQCRAASVVFGGGVDCITRSFAAEKLLVGRELSDRQLQEAAEAVEQDIEPATDHRASAAYRLAVAKVLAKRALILARDRLG